MIDYLIPFVFFFLIILQVIGFSFFLKPFFQLSIQIYKRKLTDIPTTVLQNMPEDIEGKHLKAKRYDQETLFFRNIDFLKRSSHNIVGKVIVKDNNLVVIVFLSFLDMLLLYIFIALSINPPIPVIEFLNLLLTAITKSIDSYFPTLAYLLFPIIPTLGYLLFPVILFVSAKMKYNATKRLLKELYDMLIQYHKAS